MAELKFEISQLLGYRITEHAEMYGSVTVVPERAC